MSRLDMEAAAARELLAALGSLADDEEIVELTIESETDLKEALSRALAEREEARLLREALVARIETLKVRAERLKNREERITAEIAAALELAGLRTIRLPEATLTVRPATPAVIVTDESAVPQDYWRVEMRRTIDKAALRKALLAGADIEGACLANGATTLNVRT